MKALVISCAFLCALAACRSSSDPIVRRVSPEPSSPVEEHKKIDPVSGKTLHQWSTVSSGERPGTKQGKEIVLRKDGTKEWEREWDQGRPAGVWRSWYANGQMRSEVFYAGPKEERPMTFWFENGQRRMQGPARNGVRGGHWKVWYESGQLAEEGTFVGSRREGQWQCWSQDGKRAFVRTFQHDVRIDEREGTLAPQAAPADAPKPAPAPAPVPVPAPADPPKPAPDDPSPPPK